MRDAALEARVREAAAMEGAAYFGVADLGPAAAFIREENGPLAASFPLAVVVGIAVPKTLVLALAEPEADPGILAAYDRYVYHVCTPLLERMTLKIAGLIERAGYRALPVPASQRVPGKNLCGFFSHKLAANLAGLGWVGKSSLLVTPKEGPRVRWCTVLTDAPLTAGSPLSRDCGKCNRCAEACPAGAIKGRAFDPREPRSLRVDVQKCEEYRNRLAAVHGVRTCGLCLAVCPFTK